MIDYQVRLIDFPEGKVKEAVTENEDGTYTIFISTSLSCEEQRKSFLHALRHIENGDFDKTDADSIELYAHDMDIALEFCV